MTKEQMIEDFELIELEEVEDLSVPLHGNNSNVGTDQKVILHYSCLLSTVNSQQFNLKRADNITGGK